MGTREYTLEARILDSIELECAQTSPLLANWIGGATCGVGAERVKGTVVETWLCTHVWFVSGLRCFPDTPASTHSKRANWIRGATCGVGAEGVKGTVVETRLHPEASDFNGIFRGGGGGDVIFIMLFSCDFQ